MPGKPFAVRGRFRRTLLGLGTAALLAATGAVPLAVVPSASGATALPKYDHIVVVVEENTNYSEIIGNSSAPYINSLATNGASFSDYTAITHPSQPNYLAMFSGSTQGATDDTCPPPGSPYSADNLGKQLIDAGQTFGSYNEDWNGDPTVCTVANYARKHNPWMDFTNVPTTTAHAMTAFPTDYTTLPTVSYVVPNLCNDMHDRLINSACGYANGDSWLKTNIDGYAQWAKTHNSLLVVTWDEDDLTTANIIPTILYGADVTPGTYSTAYNHYSLLRTIEDMYGTRTVGGSSTASDITGVWSGGGGGSGVTVTNPGAQTSTAGTAITPLTVSASGGTAPYTCAFTGLPAGISPSASGSCTVQGTPTAAGSSNVSVTATDSANSTSPAAAFTWTVNTAGGGGGGGLTIANPGTQNGKFAQSVNIPLNVSGGTSPYWCSATGLPAGEYIVPWTCTISGSPYATGTFAVTVSASDSASHTASVTFPEVVGWF